MGMAYGSLPELTDVPCGSLTKLTEVPGKYTKCCTRPVRAPGHFYKGISVPRVMCHGHTELTQVPGTGMNVVHNLHTSSGWGKYLGYGSVRTRQNTTFSLPEFRVPTDTTFSLPEFRVRVWKSYRTHGSSGYG